MKSLIALFATLIISLSTTALASSDNSSGARAASEAGPWVNCTLPDGRVDYTPSMVCKQKNGTIK
ncbi:hypothetical protein [Thaumasiovibrio sp. DFM-14]|uniref:hypothetical protein n=1 Tax=Thaumasiovibrio sp. DFM-14 TaxID=3384792 RepID=UPI00399F2DA3